MVKAAAALTLILFLGQKPMRAWFTLVARQRSSELFVLNVLLVTLGLGALTESLGLSLALGAFLAGMLIAETEYRYQVEEDIKPFRDVLLGLFFVTVGMALDLAVVFANFGWVLLLLSCRWWRSSLLIVALARAFRAPLATSLRIGFYLAQAGELALVMLTLAYQNRLIPAELVQPVLAAMILSMCAAPLVIQFAEPLVRRLTANDWLARAAQVTQIAATTMARQDHVIICGYGRSGQNLARLLDAEDIPYVALDADPQRVREAAADGSSVVYGDASRREALLSAGLTKARAVAITFANTPVALKILHHVHRQRPELPVIVRTVDDSEIDRLLEAGATEVVPEVLEGSLMLASHSLLRAGRPAQPRAEAHPDDPRGALRPVPRVLPRRDRHGGRRRQPAGAAAHGRAAGPRVGGRADARRPADRRAGRGHRRAAARRALAASRPGLALRGRRRRRAARAAGAAGAGRAEAAARLTARRPGVRDGLRRGGDGPRRPPRIPLSSRN